MFDHDDAFLVNTYESIVSNLPDDVINTAKSNRSYYDFHIKTAEHIIVPRHINFTFKYLHLIKEDNPEYWNKLLKGWNTVISPNFGDPLDPANKRAINDHFDKLLAEDYFDILPPLVDQDDTFLYFKNLEREAKEVTMSITSASLFHKLYDEPVVHKWNEEVNVFLFPVNNTCFYGLVNNRLTMLYPKWNAFRWSYEMPKFIINTQHPSKIVKFKNFDVETEQISIRMMNGMPKKELFTV